MLTLGQLSDHISRANGNELELRVLRGSVPLAVYLAPRANPPPGEGPMGVSIRLLNPVFERRVAPVWQAPWNGIVLMGNVVTGTATEIRRAISSSTNPGIAGPVGIAQATGEAAQQGPDFPADHRRPAQPQPGHPEPAAHPCPGRRPHPVPHPGSDPARTTTLP